MTTYLIEGPTHLKGSLTIYGNKNEVLPVLAASLLSDKPLTISNIPKIRDVNIMLNLLTDLGSQYRWLNNSTIEISTPKITKTNPDPQLVSKLRASILLVGPLLARAGQAKISFPGGDIIGRRPIDTHIDAFNKIGVNVCWENGFYSFKKPKTYTSGRVFLKEASVTATENFLLAVALSPNSSFLLLNAATEPHVRSFAQFLNQMGVNIQNIGMNQLMIQGMVAPQAIKHTILPDHIEAGTFILLSACTNSPITIKNVIPADMEPILSKLELMGIHSRYLISLDNHTWPHQTTSLDTFPSRLKSVEKIETNIWPGFPTDLMSPLIVAATQAQGMTLCHDWMYEGRMFFVDKLIRMGAKITVSDPHRVVIFGPTKLFAKELESPDIRAGMALVMAAIIAKGKSTIHQAHLIERGYANLVPRLQKLGVKIKSIDD
ncbi:MAG: UDP-N-acetylglucosamine 1-carboxyvinyltransferase [bacterium]|nr:UDP-N-acetylglucosamine 1-carboxyvinyltransferase [bacterium]